MYDTIIIGGGIVGLATARELLKRNPTEKLLLVEKETELARHQSGHNSGVLHSGIYYKPGSKKAELCVSGHSAMIDYCDTHDIPYRLCGKVIVALDETERPRLEALYERGQQNGVRGLEMVGPERLREIEPAVRGVAAIWSPRTGVVDYRAVALSYADEVRGAGGEIITSCEVLDLNEPPESTVVQTTQGDYEARRVITCAGLWSDRISGERETVRIVPFRGSYYTLAKPAADRVNGLIYPVPDPRFPFLGVHFTRTINDEVWVGPNAVLAFARKGYDRWNINTKDLFDTLSFGGFWRLAGTYWKTGAAEIYRDFVKSAYVRTAQDYLPELTPADFLPGPAGVRAQALRADGGLVDDFLIKHSGKTMHVQNAPSPAATSSLAIANYLADAITEATT